MGEPPVRILVVHSRYRSGSVSGENAVVADETRLLKEAGHEVHVFEASVSRTFDALRAAPGAIWDPGRAAAVRRLIRRYRPDMFPVHNLFPAPSREVIRAAAAARVWRSRGGPWVIGSELSQRMYKPGGMC